MIAAEDKSNEEIDLGGKSHFTFGRLEDTCDICLVGGWHVSLGALLILHGDSDPHFDSVLRLNMVYWECRQTDPALDSTLLSCTTRTVVPLALTFNR